MKGAGKWALGAAFLGVFILVGSRYGFIRTALAIALFLGLTVFGVRWLHSAVTSPPEPEVADISGYGLRYVCTMCGLELKIEVAARDKAPTHCMEPMTLVRTGGSPPLRPVD